MSSQIDVAHIQFQDNLPANPADSNIEGADDSAGRAKTWTWGLGGVIELMTQLAGETLGRGKRYLARWSLPPSIRDRELPPIAGENAEVPVPVSGSGDLEEEVEKATDATGGSGSFRFPRFDIVQSPSDHHYLETTDPEVHSTRHINLFHKYLKLFL